MNGLYSAKNNERFAVSLNNYTRKHFEQNLQTSSPVVGTRRNNYPLFSQLCSNSNYPNYIKL